MNSKNACNRACLLCMSLFAFVLCNGFFASVLMAYEQVVVTVETENHQQAIEAWRAARHERLNKPDGWLTLVGLEWIEPGETRVSLRG